MPAREAASALANELVNRMARSKPPAFSASACAPIARMPDPRSGTTASTPGTAAHTSVNGAGAATARCAPGCAARITAMAGNAMTMSPSQFGARTTIRRHSSRAPAGNMPGMSSPRGRSRQRRCIHSQLFG